MRALEEQGEMTRGLTAVMTASYRTIATRVRLLSCLVSSRLDTSPCLLASLYIARSIDCFLRLPNRHLIQQPSPRLYY
jgi:hypothetical protein